MEFGLVLTQFTDRWDHVVNDAVSAEQAGLDSIWLVDHLLGVVQHNTHHVAQIQLLKRLERGRRASG